MTTPTSHRMSAVTLAGLLLGLSMAAAAASSGVMRVGLTLVDEQAPTRLPDPASLDFPANARAIRCESDGQRYRECQTPFHGPVTLAREVSGTRCIRDQNWGWREGRVWVDQGCAAVFVTTAGT